MDNCFKVLHNNSDESNGISIIEQMRQKNRDKMMSLLEEEFKNEDLSDVIEAFKPPEICHVTEKRNSLKKNKDSTFVFRGALPTIKKRSARLANHQPEYGLLDEDVDDDVDNPKKHSKQRKFYDPSEDIENLETVVSRPARLRPKTSKIAIVPYKSAEEITDSYIENISKKSNVKVRDEEIGTTCHQCRQKTRDSKTYCRSGRCTGARGQFCGVCLLNRYGEEAAVALKDPKWSCPPCRNLCNCSICRTRQGKRPTGILAPVAQREGYKSVSDFLKYLQTLGNHIEPSDDYYQNKAELKVEDTETVRARSNEWSQWEDGLIGFDNDGNPVLSTQENRKLYC